MTGTPRRRPAAAFAVHLLTLSGAVLALAALLAASGGDWPLTFALLGAAVIVDGVDGPLARRFDVATALPRWRGETLDQIVDYVTYVFVPAYLLHAAGLMPAGFGFAAAALVCVTAGLNFADRSAKAADSFFVGFPAVWNVVVFHLVAFGVPPWIALALVVLCAAATFLPVHFVHPLRVAALRPLTLAMTALWAVSAVATLAQDMRPGPLAAAGLLVPAAYVLVLAAWRGLRR